MPTVTASLAAALALVAGGVQGRVEDERPRAPDGARGLGVETELTELLRLFYQPDEADEALLAELFELGPALGIAEATTLALYRTRGLFAVLDAHEDETLDALHARLSALDADPETYLAGPVATARAWARLLLDTRLRVRAWLFRGWRDEVRQVEAGLAVLRANTEGWARLSAEETRNLATRVDLASALLRARIRDLGALREAPDAPSEVDEADVERLLSVLALGPGPERLAALEREHLRVLDEVERMRALLSSTALEAELAGWLRWRAAEDARALTLSEEARVWHPGTEEGAAAPAEIRRLKKTTRRREALGRALAGAGRRSVERGARLRGRSARAVRLGHLRDPIELRPLPRAAWDPRPRRSRLAYAGAHRRGAGGAVLRPALRSRLRAGRRPLGRRGRVRGRGPSPACATRA